jgi:class 3 adenylate cyclase/pimeloyl-ACP methyl ester carboxylesterase
MRRKMPAMAEIPETKYAKTVDGVNIAFQVRGGGPVDLAFILGFASNFEVELEDPRGVRFADRLSSFSRLILFDKRGSGMSDRHQTPDLEMRADDLRAVLDSVGSKQVVLYGESEGGALAAFFAATHPERVLGLVLYGSQARYARAPDYPMGMTQEEFLVDQEAIANRWGTIAFAREWARAEAPSLAHDEELVRQSAKTMRYGASPAEALAFNEVRYGTDVRGVLGGVQAPTLVIWRAAGDWGAGDEQAARYLADRIPGAKYQELPGSDYWPRAGNMDGFLDALEGFVDSIRAEQTVIDRVLATVLFTDIVGSTERAAVVGDKVWKALLERHHEVIRALIGRYRGREVDTTGDGFLATFDGPARAIRCATSITEAVRDLGIEIRAGLHTGECELVDDKVGGIAVHIGARVAALAGPSEVLVSSTVKDLVAGSGLTFEDAGEHQLKGVPDRWHLYRVVS